MAEDFCKRTARRIRKFGYAPQESVRISRFCYVSMVSVCGVMGSMLDHSLMSLAEEEDISLRQLPCWVPSHGMNILATGSGDFSLGAPAGMISPVSSRIHRL
jgi:hypothetical protein